MRTSNQALWDHLIDHPFPAAMAAATLPPTVFRYYISQNLLYLHEYAKVLALGVAASKDLAMMRWFAADLANILDTEIATNRELLQAIEALCPDGPGPVAARTVAAPATVAYTNWLLAQGHSGDPLAVATAILPCAWSYGEIGARWAPGAQPHPVYHGWISFFASAEYHTMVEGMIGQLDVRYAALNQPALDGLNGIFATACRLERLFWDDALALRTWPN